MTNDDGRKPEGAPERSPKAGVGAPSGDRGNGRKRFSVQRKMAIVARLLRGEPLELVAREANVSIATRHRPDGGISVVKAARPDWQFVTPGMHWLRRLGKVRSHSAAPCR
jgi:hypothetical protein